MLAVNRVVLPTSQRCSLVCTNSIENMVGTMRSVSRHIKRWRNAGMALRWKAAGMRKRPRASVGESPQTTPGFKGGLIAHAMRHVIANKIESQTDAA